MAIESTDAHVTSPAYGLFPAADFMVTMGYRADSATIPQARWFFREETIAVPAHGRPIEGLDPRSSATEALLGWNALTLPGSARDYPDLVWIGSPELIEQAWIDAKGENLRFAGGLTGFALTPRLESNRSYYNADSTDFFAQRELRLRGKTEGGRFVARSIWPADFRLDPDAAFKPIAATPEAIRAFVRSEPRGGAQSNFTTQVIWQRDADSRRHRAGSPLLGIMLNGAQGDDDEAHGGHFGLFTGRVGSQGQMHDWLMANFYTLETESEKGIIAAMLPLECYLADLNGGQAWYRPSCLLVATLRDERTALHLSSALARVFNQFYRHQFAYHHAAANCTGICISTLRTIGWRVPSLGPSSWLKAIAGLPVVAATTGSLSKGKAIFDYLTEDQTRLFPAIAFEQAGADLLRLLKGRATRELTPYEELLRQDVEEIMLVRIPQLPSDRAWGDYPVASVDEYRQRLPKDPAKQQIVPVDPRHFPPGLKDPSAPEKKPLRSDYAVAAYAALAVLIGGFLLRFMSHRRRGKRERVLEQRDD